MSDKQPKKILIIRFSSIGDIVLTSPVIRCLKQQINDCELHYLTKNNFKEIVQSNPHISKIYSINENILEVIEDLKKENYDCIIDLHDNIRSHQISAALNKKTFRYNKQRLKRFLLVHFKMDVLHNHIVDRYFSAVKKINVINDGKGLDYFIPENEEISATQLPFTHIAGFGVIVIGARHFTKQIPKEKLEIICKGITIPIILLGGKEDAYLGTQLESIDNFKIYNACGKYSIHQSASVIKKAKWIITPDTGMMHIAAAFNKRIISVWGGTEKRLGYTPYNNQANSAMIENTNLSCRPWHKPGLEACPKKHFKCMEELDMQKIIAIL